MPKRLKRHYGAGYLHFITSSCYQRRPLLVPEHRDLFLQVLEQVRRSYRFVVAGYVVMPEHFHLLIGEPERSDPSVVIQVLKQRFARKLGRQLRRQGHTVGDLWQTAFHEGHVWQRRFYDFVVSSEHKRVEKLRYMHGNPIDRGLVAAPGDWPWSSFRYYAFEEEGPVLVTVHQRAELRVRAGSPAAEIINREDATD